MRTIKFRCFNKRTKEMKDVQRIFFNENTVEVYKDSDNFDNLTWFLDHCELMQFTGLQDCKGVDIYEGDIIKNPLKDLFEICWARKDMDYCGYCCRHGKSNTRSLFISSDFKNCEVIGNVHENPDLIPDFAEVE